MGKRKSISKSTRFEVFKRDSFKCQYCGRTPPDVILEVDHIVPVSKGGTDDILNLITSCRDCNRGKGKKTLDDGTALERQKNYLSRLNDVREQTEMMIEWKNSLLEIENSQISAIEKYLESNLNYFPGFNSYDTRLLKKAIREFGFAEVYEAVQIAYDRYSRTEALYKVGGICYNRRKQRNEGNAK